MNSPEYESEPINDKPEASSEAPEKKAPPKKKATAKKKVAKKAAKKKTAKKTAAKKKVARKAAEAGTAAESVTENAAPVVEAFRTSAAPAEGEATSERPVPPPAEAMGAATTTDVQAETPRDKGQDSEKSKSFDRHPERPPHAEEGHEHRPRRDKHKRNRHRRRRDFEDGHGHESAGEASAPRKEIDLGPPTEGSGLVELSPKGFGFLRQPSRNFYQTNKDTFIPPDMVRDYSLRDGLIVKGEVRRGPRGPQLTAIHTINDGDPAKYKNLPVFEELTAINPNKRWILETDPKRHTTRIIDMMAPVGRGQRGLIVAPPRTGKTTLIEHIAEAVSKNYPKAKLILLLVDERPEEVTELTRALPGAEIMASSNDNDTRTHMRVAQLTIERAKRLVEAGEDVFILLDSITRLARAFNRAMKGKGGINKGGLSNRALEIPRRLFAAARNTREAGSLTILATALIETGTMMDEAIFQEFKGTGNMELVLDKKIAQHYVYPAVDIFKSGTRREELLLPPHQIEKIYFIRRGLSGHKPIEAIERLLSFVERFNNNAQMLLEIKAPAAAN